MSPMAARLRAAVAVLVFATVLVGPVATKADTVHAVVAGANGRLVFTRQICETDEDPCWEIVVSNAGDTE
jgi:hypothetical protein